MKFDTQKLEKARLLRGWNLTKLAKEAGTTQTSLTNLFRYKTTSIPTLKKVASALDLTLDQVLIFDLHSEGQLENTSSSDKPAETAV